MGMPGKSVGSGRPGKSDAVYWLAFGASVVLAYGGLAAVAVQVFLGSGPGVVLAAGMAGPG